jgi:hypothetical protein
MKDFDKAMEDRQIKWRLHNIDTKERGSQNNKTRDWILPQQLWEQGLAPSIRSGQPNSLPQYLADTGVQKHTGVHNLKSSWMLCANLYFPFRKDLKMIAEFLRETISSQIEAVEKIELEWAEGYPFDPTTLLGEPLGQRGRNQTSPDIALLINGGKGIILTENKFTEHSFYGCSGRNKQYGNPDISRCMNFENVCKDRKNQCYQLQWANGDRTNRKYWDYLKFTEEAFKKLKRCPAATAGYQLFRQQALAEALATEGKYDIVISCVAYDDRNQILLNSLHGTGIESFTDGWGPLFDGKARFATFTHQKWVRWVREHDTHGAWGDWLKYVEERYGYI